MPELFGRTADTCRVCAGAGEVQHFGAAEKAECMGQSKTEPCETRRHFMGGPGGGVIVSA